LAHAIATQTHRENKAMARVKSLDNNSFAIILEYVSLINLKFIYLVEIKRTSYEKKLVL
jgi:hypothetical protein